MSKILIDEATVKLALEALESCGWNDGYAGENQYFHDDLVDKAITALREALAEQPAQPMHPEIKKMYEDYFDKCFREGYVPEPDKRQQALDKKAENARELGLDYEPAKDNSNYRLDQPGLDPLYTSPPAQRTWAGLTNNELQPIADEYRIVFGGWVEDFARAIEAKLKEKNT